MVWFVDSYLLRNGYNDNGGWDSIGTVDENKVTKYDVTVHKKPKLAEYLSYDELIISAMCGISSPTHFINDGNRSLALLIHSLHIACFMKTDALSLHIVLCFHPLLDAQGTVVNPASTMHIIPWRAFIWVWWAPDLRDRM